MFPPDNRRAAASLAAARLPHFYKIYPAPHTVSIIFGFCASSSIFSRKRLTCTDTVAASPTKSKQFTPLHPLGKMYSPTIISVLVGCPSGIKIFLIHFQVGVQLTQNLFAPGHHFQGRQILFNSRPQIFQRSL